MHALQVMQDFAAAERVCDLRLRHCLTELHACVQQVELAYAAGMGGGRSPKDAAALAKSEIPRHAAHPLCCLTLPPIAPQYSVAFYPMHILLLFAPRSAGTHSDKCAMNTFTSTASLSGGANACRLRKALTRAKRSHLELRALLQASQCGNDETLTVAVSELFTSYQQLTKWYEESHFLLDDYARMRRQMQTVKKGIYEGAGKASIRAGSQQQS